jgi:hypothetical protein
MQPLAGAEQKAKRKPFEGVDVRESGRRGGIASGLARRYRFTEELRRQVVEGSGMAAYAAAQLLRENLEARERAVRVAEREMHDAEAMRASLDDEIEQQHATLGRLQAQERTTRERIERLTTKASAELADLARQRDELRRAIATEAAAAGLEWDDDGDVVAPEA